jgi:putative methylase
MKLKQLESLLQDVEAFREPNQMLEQYPTGAHLASRCIGAAEARGDIENRVVVDLGVGGGVLTIASLLMGARKVIGVDVDPHALELTRANCLEFDPPLRPTLMRASVPQDILRVRKTVGDSEIARIDLENDRETCRPETSDGGETNETTTTEVGKRGERLSCDDESAPEASPDELSEELSQFQTLTTPLRAHTVVMNPPFGTRVKGADMGFLRAGLTIASGAVYSLHKTSTRAHVEKHALRTLRARRYVLHFPNPGHTVDCLPIVQGKYSLKCPERLTLSFIYLSAVVLAELRYELPKVYAHHRKESVEIEVDLWRFEPPLDGLVGGQQMDGTDSDDSDDDGGKNSDVETEVGAEKEKIELKYSGARNAFCDRRDFEPRTQKRSGGKGGRDPLVQQRGGRSGARGGRGGGAGRGGR